MLIHAKKGLNMKKSILSVLLLLGVSAGAFAQGTIFFQNFTQSGGGLVYFGDTLATGTLNLELFYGPVGSTLDQLLNGGSGFGDFILNTSTTSSAAGKFFDGTAVTTTGPAGLGTTDPTLNVELAIGGWIGNYADFEQALEGTAFVAVTAPWANPTGNGGSPPAPGAGLIDWTQGNSLIIAGPEPSTLAIAGLGVGALLLFRRRK
jgi:hypothetical protein